MSSRGSKYTTATLLSAIILISVVLMPTTGAAAAADEHGEELFNITKGIYDLLRMEYFLNSTMLSLEEETEKLGEALLELSKTTEELQGYVDRLSGEIREAQETIDETIGKVEEREEELSRLREALEATKNASESVMETAKSVQESSQMDPNLRTMMWGAIAAGFIAAIAAIVSLLQISRKIGKGVTAYTSSSASKTFLVKKNRGVITVVDLIRLLVMIIVPIAFGYWFWWTYQNPTYAIVAAVVILVFEIYLTLCERNENHEINENSDAERQGIDGEIKVDSY